MAGGLTERHSAMLRASGHDRLDGCGFGVELRGSAWHTARSLVARGFGWIEGDPGAEQPGLYFNNADGVEMIDPRLDEEVPF